MGSLARVKQEIQFNGRLGGLLDALKSIAAQQFQTLERTARFNSRFFEAIEMIAGTFDLAQFDHPFTQARGPIGVIAVTSDTGLLGGLNQQVVSTALAEHRQAAGEVMVIGERGVSYVREAGVNCRVFPGLSDSGQGKLAAQVRDYALDQVRSGRLGALTIVYPRALSFTVQQIEVAHALPCTAWFSDRATQRGVRSGGPILLESRVSDVVEYLAWLWLGYKLLEVFQMSRLAELAARAVHLEGSSQELQRRRQRLWLRYFRERHEVIDRNMRELFSARLLYGEPEEEPLEEAVPR